VQDFVQNLIDGISAFFSGLYDGAPLVLGSKYPVFLLELLVIIVILDLFIFGWRPLVRKFFPDNYHSVDYYFAQSVNVMAFLLLVVFDFYLGAQLGDAWGTWIGISGMIWITVAILGVMFAARFVTSMLGDRAKAKARSAAE
jgi:hypothetical protein